MKKQIAIATLVLVVLKFTYNIYSVVYNVQQPLLERYFNLAILFILFYYAFTGVKKRKVKANYKN
ncbi:hypothetical protein GN157_00280 [Flavobacterium rakeshii]|uniref:Uncharacterized protein n=1 Tax=Flavobacterium rakeshii TaxID=1038845 RepID=A0A6N8H881_9FLAO|nr:hypothetical protein [Flavobacterium rakeshii]MUV02133.1 hypothetical protein [Flavobacterium rakeshii]